MDKPTRCALYEKFYFHELDRREKVSARLALPFAVLIADAGLLSFMLNSASQPVGAWRALFWGLFFLSCCALIVGAWFFRYAWFGHTDRLLPTAGAIEAYHAKLSNTYAAFADCDQLVTKYFEEFLFTYYRDSSSENAINNDARSYNIYRATVALTFAVLLAFASAIPFFLGQPIAQAVK